MSTISKSDYILYLKHPAWLWLKKHDKTKLPPIDDNTQAIFDAGNKFESYSEQLFSDAIKLGFDTYEEYERLPKRTADAYNKGAKSLLQARFFTDGITCICDVVVFPDRDTIDLYEIKSSTKVKPEHIPDLAFQTVVLERCGFKVRNISVIVANSDYVRQGDIDVSQLTQTIDVTDKVRSIISDTEKNIQAAKEMLSSGERPDLSPRFASADAFAEWSDIYRALLNMPPGTIFDLCQITREQYDNLVEQGIKKLEDIPENFALKPKQAVQLEAVRKGKPIIHADKIKEYLESLKYPLYFLDYETLASVVPYFNGTRPYQQIPFQYSLHILESPDSELRQVEYLHRENTNPAQPLADKLIQDIGDAGSVIVWYQGFEKARNSEMGAMVPEYSEKLKAINNRVVDLMVPFSSGWYVDAGFLGSASIKHVLPVLVPKLSYKALDIQEGGSAQRLWMEAILDGKRDGERDKILSDLTEYCKLDTLAMVEIFNVLRKI